MTRELVPGRCGLRRNPPFQGRMEALNWKTRGANLGRTLSDRALSRAPVGDALSLLAKDGRQNIRDNNAARVAGPGRICFWRPAPSIQLGDLYERMRHRERAALQGRERILH